MGMSLMPSHPWCWARIPWPRACWIPSASVWKANSMLKLLQAEVSTKAVLRLVAKCLASSADMASLATRSHLCPTRTKAGGQPPAAS